jgi:lipoyl(octanoyl) transferase
MEWKTSPDLVKYDDAIAFMERRVAAIREQNADEIIWFLEHPPLYTAGTSAKAEDLIAAQFPVHQTGRGGQYTYHGPGQRIAYIMLDLQKRGGDVRKFVQSLEEAIIHTLADLDITGERRDGRIGIWTTHHEVEEKIAAIGVRVTKGVTWHGLSLNINPDLAHYAGIIPCGISEYGVTSLQELGVTKKMQEIDVLLQQKLGDQFF